MKKQLSAKSFTSSEELRKRTFIPSSLSNELNHLQQLALNFRNNSPKTVKQPKELLKYAVLMNYPHTVNHLLDIGTEVTLWNINYFEVALSVENYKNWDLRILYALYVTRNVTFGKLYEAIFRTMQLYLSPANAANRRQNNMLIDKVVSTLLCHDIVIEKLVSDDYSCIQKYIEHLFYLTNECSDEWVDEGTDEGTEEGTDDNVPGESRKGLHARQFLPLHLRLFFHKIIEILLSNVKIKEQIIEEFLCLLETTWLHRQHLFWISQGIKTTDDNLLPRVTKEVLVPYVYKRITQLPVPTQARCQTDTESLCFIEYVIYTLLPGHSIYIAFKKVTPTEIEIRVDNKGAYATDDNGEPYARHIATVNFQTDKQQLEKYLHLIFETTWKCLVDETNLNEEDGNNFARNLYNQSKYPIFTSPSIPTIYPSFAEQTAENCTHYSWVLGQSIRLADKSGTFALPMVNLLKTTVLYIEHPENQLLEENKLPAKQNEFRFISYKTWLQRHLANYYLTLHANLSPIPYMHSQIPDWSWKTFKEHSAEIKLLVEGEAGIGKTIYSQQVALKLQHHFIKKAVVFYLPLRTLQSEEQSFTLLSVVEKYILKRTIPTFEKSLLQTVIDDPHTTWILDGLDELIIHHSLNIALSQLFERKRILVTVRPQFSLNHLKNHIQSQATWVNSCKLIPYTTEDKHKLIDYHFSNFTTPTVGALKNQLKEIIVPPLEKFENKHRNPHLQKICEVPIFLQKICHLLLAGHQLLHEKDLAVINETFITSLIANANIRRNPGGSIHKTREISQFTKTIRFMEKLAFKSLESERIIYFSKDIVDQLSPKNVEDRTKIEQDLKDIGLIQLDAAGGQFIHTSYQDHFAARYIIKGLKYGEWCVKAKSIKQFITNHKFNSKYDNVFLCIIQLFKNKINQPNSEDKQVENWAMFNMFLTCYFSAAPESALRCNGNGRNSNEWPVSVLSGIYSIADKNEEVKQYATTVLQVVGEMVDSASSSSIPSLRQLFSEHPRLGTNLELTKKFITKYDDLKKLHRSGIPQHLLTELVYFAVNFKVSVPLSLLLDFKPNTTDGAFQALLLRAIKISLREDTINVDLQAANEIHQMAVNALLTSQASKSFACILAIQAPLGLRVPEILNDMAGKPSSYMFIEFLISCKPYQYINDQLIPKFLCNTQVPLSQSLYYKLSKFLLIFVLDAKTQSLPQLEIAQLSFTFFCNHYAPQAPDKLITQAELLAVVDAIFTTDQHASNQVTDLVFKSWNTIVDKETKYILSNYHWCLNRVMQRLAHPKMHGTFKYENLLVNYIKNIITNSTVSNKHKCYWGSRTKNWQSIGFFLANIQLVETMDTHVDTIIDLILENYVKHKVHGNSTLHCEIKEALSQYYRPISTEKDNKRQKKIKDKIPHISFGAKSTLPQEKPLLFSPSKSKDDQPKTVFKFFFDQSYYGYSFALVHLHFLVSHNPPKALQMITDKIWKNLKILQEELIAEISETKLDASREQAQNDKNLVEKILSQLEQKRR